MSDRGNPTAEDEEPAPLGAAAPLRAEGSGRERTAPRARSRRFGPVVLTVLVIVVVVGLALVPVVWTGFEKTPQDRIGISYGGGVFEGEHFQRVVEPGSSLFFNGISDRFFLYPSDQINYIVTKAPDQGAEDGPDSVIAPTQDRVQAEYQVAVFFKLNTDLLREFHEQVGLRYRAYTDGGWDRLLEDTFRQQIENALQEETRKVDVADLFGSAERLVSLQEAVQARLSERMEATLGERFFCAPTFRPGGTCDDPTFLIKKVEVPEAVAAAFEENRTSEIAVETRQNEVEQRSLEAEAIAALGLDGEDYVLLRAIEDGKIEFWVVGEDTDVNVPVAPPSDAGG